MLVILVINREYLALKTLLLEFLFLGLKNVLDVKLLEVLIREINAQLLQGIHFKIFVSENVQKSDRSTLAFSLLLRRLTLFVVILVLAKLV